MILLEDTRNQTGKHDKKNEFFKLNGIEVRRTKLYTGDYTLPTNQSICVDTKKDIQELVGDICGKSHERFRNELIRAQESGIKLYILVENEGGEIRRSGIFNQTVRSIDDLFSWKNPRLFIMRPDMTQIIGYRKSGSPMYRQVQKYPNATKGATLAKACITMQEKYGVKFCFCSPEESGAKILELLGVKVDGGE